MDRDLHCELSVFGLAFWEIYDDRRRNVPKGTLGFVPYIGETLEFRRSPAAYASRRSKRYGSIFKGGFLGLRAVVSTDPYFSSIRDAQGEDNFSISLPGSSKALLGDTYNMSHEQSGLRKAILGLLLPEGLKAHIKVIETLIVESLAEWEGKIVPVSRACKRNITLHLLLGDDGLEKKYRLQIFTLIPVFVEAVAAVPIYFPGTLYYRGYQARRKIVKLIARIIKRRRETSSDTDSSESKDLLDVLLHYKTEEGKELDLNQISDVLCSFFYGAEVTTPAAMTCTIKELSKRSSILRAASAQCDSIEERRFHSGPLTMADVRNMRFLQNIFKETLRKYSIVPFTLRQAQEDIEINGILIPRKWYAVTMSCHMHMNRDFWVNPEDYNPSRFEMPPCPKTFIPFGAGVHMCPGRSLAELVACVFFYHLLRKYRWKTIDSFGRKEVNKEELSPRPASKEEVRIAVYSRNLLAMHLPPARCHGLSPNIADSRGLTTISKGVDEERER